MAVLFTSLASYKIFIFYTIFEFSLIPIFIIVLGWGYQPERLSAGINLIIYTIFASFPLFIILMFYSFNQHTGCFFIIERIFKLSCRKTRSSLLYIFLHLGFLVKFPIFIFHL